MERVQSVYKGTEVGFGNNKYKAVSHDDVTRLLHNEFVKEKIIMIPNVISNKIDEQVLNQKKGPAQSFSSFMEIEITLVNAENPEDSFKMNTSGFSFDSQDKASGKAYSYAVKYALLKLFMLESSDDEEQRLELESIKNPPRPFVPATEKQIDIILKLINETGTEPSDKTIEWASKLSSEEADKTIKALEEKTGTSFS
jgi:hypothetical protein